MNSDNKKYEDGDTRQFVNYLVEISEKNADHIMRISQNVASINTKLEYVPTRDEMMREFRRHSKNPIAHGRVQMSRKTVIGLIASILALIPIAVAAYNAIFK